MSFKNKITCYIYRTNHYFMLKFFTILFLFIPFSGITQSSADGLSVEKIMADPKWIGTSPSNPFWGADGETLYFNWNPEKVTSDSIYYITTRNRQPVKASVPEKQNLLSASALRYNKNKTAYTYSKN